MSLSLAVALSFATAHAQQASSTTNKEADEALHQKAFDLLESLASQISILQSRENRARLGANIADSLWEHDEQRARTLLVSVQDEINSALQNQQMDQRTDPQRRMVFLQLRINIVDRIANHDPQLALSFFHATELPVDPAQPGNGAMRMDERAFELRLAQQIAEKKPEIALSLARQSLAKGLSPEVIQLLRQLNRKHKDEAMNLYDEIVTKLKGINLLTDASAVYFAENLVRSFSPPAVDDARFREVIGLIVNAGIANGCTGKIADDDERSYLCNRIGSLLPLIKKADPTRAASLKRWESEEGEVDSYSDYQEINELAQSGTVDEILALAKQHPRLEQMVYWRAMQKAQESGDIDRARKIATDYAGDPEVKQGLLGMVNRQERMAAELRKHLKDLQTTLDAMITVEERVEFLLLAANQMAAADQKEADKLLNQATELADNMKPGKEQIGVQITLALTYCSRNNPRGLVMMETLMPKLNELISAAARLDGYENNYLREGEWNMTREGILGALLTYLAENSKYFAWCDFERATSVAGQFERPEVRLMAQIKLAQSILAGRPKPFANRFVGSRVIIDE